MRHLQELTNNKVACIEYTINNTISSSKAHKGDGELVVTLIRVLDLINPHKERQFEITGNDLEAINTAIDILKSSHKTNQIRYSVDETPPNRIDPLW